MSRTLFRGASAMMLAVLAGAGSAAAALLPVDDFQSFADGQAIHGLNGWSATDFDDTPIVTQVFADPALPASGNRVLSVAGGGKNNVKAVSLGDGQIGTLFFRFQVPSGSGSDMAIGLSSLESPWAGDHVASSFRVLDHKIQAYDGGFQEVGSIDSGTWYDVWLVIDNNAKTWQGYIQGGAFAAQTPLSASGDDTFAFRPIVTTTRDNNPPPVPASTTIGDLVSLNIRSNNGHAGDTTYFDDVFFDATGANLSNPVPEPATAAMAGVAGLALVLRRRR